MNKKFEKIFLDEQLNKLVISQTSSVIHWFNNKKKIIVSYSERHGLSELMVFPATDDGAIAFFSEIDVLKNPTYEEFNKFLNKWLEY